MIRLIGVLIIVLGFYFRLDILGVVLTAGIVTGLVAGIEISEVLIILGEAFVENRYMSVFLVTLPAIGILERYGLRQRAAYLIGRIKGITTGKVLAIYTVFRTLASAFSVRVGGHPQFIRPLILPMAEGAAREKYPNLSNASLQEIKGLSGAVENYGNFYGQNVFVASGGTLLIVGTLQDLGYDVSAIEIAMASIPIAIIATIIGVIQCFMLDRKLQKNERGDS
ncbi:DUF969 domain-containing protein [Natranaerobius trueperi]|uniref:DUF969 domain-containing protein n=1 Tax=Natranaerobius trueperi TaxID=759412 RepID=A0A226C084_9FIRM|nr:DUF969 domain-containing protein [Natranaerobius trueperi]OWZ84663.1 hypothetical protein CDO51_02565 [Natranaerobius trueperi]